MPRYFALLRAINVGGHTVTMAKLKQLFQAEGATETETYLASGNLSFQSRVRPDLLARRIERRLFTALGFEVATFVRTADELLAVHAHQPFPPRQAAQARALGVGFLATAPDAATRRRVKALSTDDDLLLVHGREVYLLCHNGFGQSTVTGKALESALGQPTTVRNVKTVARLAATC